MEYILPAAFLIGLLLFVLSWLRVIFAGFGHHAVTGLVAAVPVLNLLILPGIWHKVYGWVLAGIIGLIIAVGSWYSGADKHLYRYASEAGMELEINTPTTDTTSVTTEGLDLKQKTQTSANTDKQEPAVSTSGKELPKTALYKVSFKAITTDMLLQSQGRYVRLTRNDRKVFEGKVISTDTTGIVIERRVHGGTLEQPFELNVINKAEVID